MMILLEGGPVERTGAVFEPSRLPLFLRAVQNSAGKLAVLDLPEDQVQLDETVYVYRRGRTVGSLVRYSGRGCVPYSFTLYHFMPDVDGEPFRDVDAWRAWAEDAARKGSK